MTISSAEGIAPAKSAISFWTSRTEDDTPFIFQFPAIKGVMGSPGGRRASFCFF
jgi:hypothetical protein